MVRDILMVHASEPRPYLMVRDILRVRASEPRP